MKILFLCHRFPLPADGGGKIRALHIVRHLVAAGHAVTLCSLVRSESEAEGALEMGRLCARVVTARVEERGQRLRMLASLATATPFSFAYFQSPELQQKIDALLRDERFDLIFAYSSSMAPYVMSDRKTPKLMDFVDMDSRKWRDYARHKSFLTAPLFALEAAKVERWERNTARAFDRCTVISPSELESLREIANGVRVDWFPNGVDLEYFTPPADEAYDAEQVAFVGRMDYFPNAEAVQWFCDEVWPAVRERRPSATFKIIGADPPRQVQSLGQVPGVEVTGFVPDVRQHLSRAAVSVAPLKIARGLQNKVLESMALGVPVVASPRVANGLGATNDGPLQVADSAGDYVNQVLAVMASPERRGELSRASRAYVEARFSWARALEQLDGSLDDLVKKNASGTSSVAIAPRG